MDRLDFLAPDSAHLGGLDPRCGHDGHNVSHAAGSASARCGRRRDRCRDHGRQCDALPDRGRPRRGRAGRARRRAAFAGDSGHFFGRHERWARVDRCRRGHARARPSALGLAGLRSVRRCRLPFRAPAGAGHAEPTHRYRTLCRHAGCPRNQPSSPFARRIRRSAGGARLKRNFLKGCRMTCRMIIDVDTGVDDAMAIFYAVRRPGVTLEALTTTFGNTDTAIATENTLRMLELLGRPEIPVARGVARSLVTPYVRRADHVHGANAIGDVELPPAKIRETGEHAADLIIRMAKENPGEIVLCPVGPVTNAALALTKAPEIAKLLRRIVIMGSTLF